ncbi:MDR family MFS transporter [Aspergillus mulundensis]|uniref:Major facilitator superfamily (MFS) profile domain-containing protein n=1 Tax=Aspergillus mulundensis TaxID=1810919 RepID=A0A3D8RSF2_9EURO|nr:hypothetical protein DSM5745_06733 [Aspergillus mulundensis]RDW76741.1 hypothetical protein DSM5745_06733 [Aspergillus mulundensis]
MDDSNSSTANTEVLKTDAPLNAQNAQSEAHYPPMPTLIIIVIALMLSMFLSIIATAIPKITVQFQSMHDIAWYGSAFFLTLAAFQSAWGIVYKIFSLRGSFLTAIAIFEVGSLICALAPNSVALIVGRAVQGMGGAGLTGGCYTIAAYIAPPARVPVIIGLLGSTFSLASIAGPLLGGVFSEHVSWRWCFYINLPIGGVAAAGLVIFFRTPGHAKAAYGTPLREKLKRFDYVGLGILLVGLVCFFLALQWGGVTRPWSSGAIIALLVLWVVLTVAFVLVEWYQGDRSLMVPRLLLNRDIGACCAFIFFLNAANFSLIYNLPIYFQAINGDSPMGSGVKNIPTILSTSIATFLSSSIVTKVGYYQPFLLVGSILATIGGGLIYSMDLSTSLAKIIGYQILYGAGTGISVQIPIIVAGALTSSEEQPIAMATVLFFQFISAAYGVGSTDSILNNLLLRNIGRYMPGVDAGNVLSAGSSALQDVFGGEMLAGARRSYLQGLRGSWALGVALFGVAVLCAVVPKRGGRLAGAGDDEGEGEGGNGGDEKVAVRSKGESMEVSSGHANETIVEISNLQAAFFFPFSFAPSRASNPPYTGRSPNPNYSPPRESLNIIFTRRNNVILIGGSSALMSVSSPRAWIGGRNGNPGSSHEYPLIVKFRLLNSTLHHHQYASCHTSLTMASTQPGDAVIDMEMENLPKYPGFCYTLPPPYANLEAPGQDQASTNSALESGSGSEPRTQAQASPNSPRRTGAGGGGGASASAHKNTGRFMPLRRPLQLLRHCAGKAIWCMLGALMALIILGIVTSPFWWPFVRVDHKTF